MLQIRPTGRTRFGVRVVKSTLMGGGGGEGVVGEEYPPLPAAHADIDVSIFCQPPPHA